MSARKTPIIEDIVDQHFEEASFLWSQRDAASTSSDYTFHELVELDERVEAHIDGLRVAAAYGWELCEAGLDHEEPGTVFVATILAFEIGDPDKIDLIVEASSKSRAAFGAVISALGWIRDAHFRENIIALVSAKPWQKRSLGIAACGLRRVNPRAYLNQALDSSNLFLKVRALKAAGQLKRTDLFPVLQEYFQHEEPSCRFQAARSALLLGDKSALNTISSFILSPSRHTLPAMQVALRVVDSQAAREWLKAQSSRPEQRRQMLIGVGITGDPVYIPMLIKQMSKPELARRAGDAFSMITGINLQEAEFEAEWPEGFEAGPNDDPADENVEMDPDEGLSWPNAGLVSRWWEQNSQSFPAGTRFLAGSPISADHCTAILKTGNQRNRQAAALELALSHPEAVLFNTRESGRRQQKRLGL